MIHTLATRLRTGTQDSHTLAENTPFMKLFLKGIITQEPFRRLLANLYFVYVALEDEMRRHQDDPVVGPMVFPVVERVAALEQDLAFYYGGNWREQVNPSTATLKYVMRIHAIANDNPSLLVAHAYVRYMGDLSGGQGLKAIARQALDLPEHQGTAFYEFEGLPSVEQKRAFKGSYRDALNAVPVSETQITQIVEEANLAFMLNRDMMKGLEGLVKQSVGEHLYTLITNKPHPGSTVHKHHQLATSE